MYFINWVESKTNIQLNSDKSTSEYFPQEEEEKGGLEQLISWGSLVPQGHSDQIWEKAAGRSLQSATEQPPYPKRVM